jgi:hypothetical protein
VAKSGELLAVTAAIPGIVGSISENCAVGSGTSVGSLLREAPFGLHARFGERVDGRVWFHVVPLAAMTDTGEPVIVGGKGPGRANYGLVHAGSYRNYAGLVTGHLAEDDFTDVAVRAAIGAAPPRHLLDLDGALVVRFNPREVAEWVEHIARNAVSFGAPMDDTAREYAQRIAPFTTLTDEDLAALDAFPGDEADAAHG